MIYMRKIMFVCLRRTDTIIWMGGRKNSTNPRYAIFPGHFSFYDVLFTGRQFGIEIHDLSYSTIRASPTVLVPVSDLEIIESSLVYRIYWVFCSAEI